MTDWHCFKCKVQMEDDDLSLLYMDMLGFEEGFRCPECEDQYLSEETVVSMRTKEEEIEAKMA